MVAILFPSGGDSEEFATALFSLIRRSGSTILMTNSACYFESNPDFLITICPPEKEIVVPPDMPCIVLLGETNPLPFSIPPKAIVLSFAETGLSISLDGSQQLISCGLRQRDTLTLSSLDRQKPVLSVQRTINTLRGQSLEVGEYPLNLNASYSHRDIIAAAAVVLLHNGTLTPDVFLGTV